MTEQEQNDHAWFREQIAGALAGGLSAAEQVRFEGHLAACPACASELAAAREMEQKMTAMFATGDDYGAAGLEDRIIAGLRELRRPRLFIHPAVRRAGATAAAVLLLACAGLLVTQKPLASARRHVAMRFDDFEDMSSVNALVPGERPAEIRDMYRYGVAGFTDVKGKESEGGDVMRKRMEVAGEGQKKAGTVYWDANFDARKVGRGTLSLNATTSDGVEAGKNITAFYAGTQIQSTGDATQDGDFTNHWFAPTQLSTSLGEPRLNESVSMDADARAPKVPGQQQEKAIEQLHDGLSAVPPATGEPAAGSSGLLAVVPPGIRVVEGKVVHAEQVHQPATRKVIRNGQMEFEVDHFDAAFAQVSKLTSENGGYVGTTDSEKLPNGKVKGTVIVRVPPDRLDTLVLQLRGIGDLKSQKLEAQDISKQYTDLESGLRAAKAMEERLIQIIKEGKGAIKDLLAAEKELGVWREKVEKITGEMRYYDNQVALSTLSVTLFERDIQSAAKATETETIDAGMETVDVEKARADVLKAIEEAKGRVIQSDLKRYDAGQFGATIVAEIPPDASGPLLDRIRQIGKIARLDIQRKQTADSNQSNTATNAPPRVEKRDTRLNLSLYNLANVAPRQSSVTSIAADDVEKAYQTILARVTKAGGRVVTSNIARSKPEQTTGTISFEVPTPEADAVTNDLRALGEVMKMAMTENPDVNNVTTAKRGFNVSLVSSTAVAPRETTGVQIASANVAGAREKILSAASAGGARVLTSQLNESDRSNPNATLEIDVPRKQLAAVEKALAEAGDAISRVVTRSSDTENTIDSKVKLQITLLPAEKMAPRETTAMTIELSDVDSAMAAMQQSAADAGGRVTEQNMSKQRDGSSTGKIAVEVPLDKAGAVVDQAKKLGAVRAVQATKNQQIPAGALARARIDVTFGTADTIVEPGRGVWATIRNGLSTSVAGLLWSLQLIVIGLCFVLPWALVVWVAWNLIKRRKPAPVPAT